MRVTKNPCNFDFIYFIKMLSDDTHRRGIAISGLENTAEIQRVFKAGEMGGVTDTSALAVFQKLFGVGQPLVCDIFFGRDAKLGSK